MTTDCSVRHLPLVVLGLLPLSLAGIGLGAAVHSGMETPPSTYASSARCAPPARCNPIKHIVFMVKENRSFDSMFGRLPGVNGAHTYATPSGAAKRLNHQPNSLTADIEHSFGAAVGAING